jgi:hypothetical protein
MHTVVETPHYLTNAEQLFTVEERAAIVEVVASDPLCGVVIREVVVSARYALVLADEAKAVARESSIFSAARIFRFFSSRHSRRTRSRI